MTRSARWPTRGAEVGVERFVLDDGRFRHRRDDHAGLGDWYVDELVWPDGLGPLVEHVRAAGMEFGLWVEPEMINVDSDLAREHPDWILSTGNRLPPEARHQQVLDLANPAAYGHILNRLDSLVREYAIDSLKWDHNRDLVEPGSTSHGRAGVHDQTLAVYRLLGELKARHLEIESCSSGGARADLGILEHTDRIWASDCIDALERQQIQRWTGLLLPLEFLWEPTWAPTSHTPPAARTTWPFVPALPFSAIWVSSGTCARQPPPNAPSLPLGRSVAAARRGLVVQLQLTSSGREYADSVPAAIQDHGVAPRGRGRDM